MHSRAQSSLTRIAILLRLLASPLSAAAEEPAPEQGEKLDSATLATARTLAVAGVKLARDGQCGQAIDSLERAEALVHSAIVAEQLGSCYRGQGRLVEAAEVFRKLLREPLPADGSEAVQQAYQRADAQLQEIKPLIATLVIAVEGPSSETLTLLVDGREVPRELFGQARLTDPGLHRVRAESPGFEAASQSVELAPGQVRRMQLALVPVAAPAAAAVPEKLVPVQRQHAAAPPPPPREQDERGRARKRRTALALSVTGGALLAAGGAFSYLAIDRKNELEQECPDSVCRPRSREELDQAQAYGLTATVGLAVGGAALVVGTVLYLATRKQGREMRRAHAAKADVPALSLGHAGLRGSF